MPCFKRNLDLMPIDIVGMVCGVYHVEISHKTAWFAFAKALAEKFRDREISYAIHPQYLQSKKDFNSECICPKSTVECY